MDIKSSLESQLYSRLRDELGIRPEFCRAFIYSIVVLGLVHIKKGTTHYFVKKSIGTKGLI